MLSEALEELKLPDAREALEAVVVRVPEVVRAAM